MTDTNRFMLLDRIEKVQPPAFEFIDGFTRKTLTAVQLSIDGAAGKIVRQVVTPAGIRLLYRLDSGTYAFRAEAEGFEPWEETVTFSIGQEPKRVVLNPSSAYDFPAGTTLIRGMVFTGTQANPVPRGGAQIALPIGSGVLSGVSSVKGEIVYYLSPVVNGNRIEIGGDWFVKSPASSNALKFDCTGAGATSYVLAAVPTDVLLSSTEFTWKIGSEVHINLFI